MKVLVTGASGFLGREIVAHLRLAGHSAREFVRPAPSGSSPRQESQTVSIGDILDPASLQRAFKGMDAVIHCAAMVSFRPRDSDRLHQTNVIGTKNVLNAAKEVGARVIVTSTVATLGETELPFLLTETNSQNPSKLSCTYEKTKLEAEYAALTAAKNGQEIIILKPGRIIGPSDGKAPSTRWIVHYLNGNLPFYIDGGVSFCDVRDVARAHVRALTQGQRGETYLLGGHNRIMSQFFADLQARTGKGPIKPLPRFLAYGLGCISELTANFYPHSLEELSRASVIKSAGYTFIDSFKAQEELGYAIRSYDETLRDTLKSLLSQSEYADVFEISEEAYS